MTEDFYAVAFLFEFHADYWKAIIEYNKKEAQKVLKHKEEEDEKKINDAREYINECKSALERKQKSLKSISDQQREWL